MAQAPFNYLVAVTGPTGSGKSELALRIATGFSGEVVNCDSLQVYRHFNIGTAKLPESERRGIPHHLIDILDPGQVCTAGDYARLGRQSISEIAARSKLPVVAGGTGFYLRALLEGLFQGPVRNQQLRERLAARESRRPGSLHRLLSFFDPESAKRIHAKDTPKLIRALEVCLLTRRSMTELFARGREPLEGFHVLKIGLNPARELLYDRIDLRCRRMFQSGLVEEVRHILSLGFPAESKAFESVGYSQTIRLVRGEFTLEQAIQDTQQSTRRYAKRQWTWFRKEADLIWFNGFGDDAGIQREVVEQVGAFL